MDEEKLKLSEYLLLCSKFEDNPEDESLLEKINEFLSKLTIREYIPLKEKEIILIDYKKGNVIVNFDTKRNYKINILYKLPKIVPLNIIIIVV